ncbi:hypothetical protein GQ53DRAFT_826683 [Thozetella sp. PMI_491]|nr:hypothetical protein GQ53DRAFT_826683 [Thozetella sp. PMI_491]
MHLFETGSFYAAALFFSGGLLGSIVTQIFVPGADWRVCRDIGVESAAKPCSERPTLELFSASNYEAAYHQVRVNGTYNKPSPFRGPPSHDVDQAWARYWKTWIFGVDEATFHSSLPEHPEAAVRLDDGRYMATFEATHQLHCLYNLFRASYLDAYPDEKADYDEDPQKWHERVDHCVEVLRQKLECDRDTTILTYNWVRGKRDPTANFNAARMCLDWGSLDDWALRREIRGLPTKPPNAHELPAIP